MPLSLNLGALTSWKPLGLLKPVMGLIYLYSFMLEAESTVGSQCIYIYIHGYYKRNRHFQRYVVSPDLTPCDFFLCGYIKDRDFVVPLPISLNELKQRITTAVASVDEDMLRSVWDRIRLTY